MKKINAFIILGVGCLLTGFLMVFVPLRPSYHKSDALKWHLSNSLSESTQESEIIPCSSETTQDSEINRCAVSVTPQIVRQSVTESLRVGDEFEITFLRILSSGVNCSFSNLKPRDVFAASVQFFDKAPDRPEIVTHGSVEFVKMVTDTSTGFSAAEYAIRGHIYDAGKHTVKLLQMYFLDSDETDLFILSQNSTDSDLGKVRFMTGFNPLKFGKTQWGWSGMWYELWTLNVTQDSPQPPRESLGMCKEMQDAVKGRWRRLGEDGFFDKGFEWQPHNCQLTSDYSFLQGKRIVMSGASIMRYTFSQLSKLLLPEDVPDLKLSASTTRSGVDITTNVAGIANVTYVKHLYCGPWDGLKDLQKPDIVIGTCGSHMWTRPGASWNDGLLDVHSKMLAGAYWPGQKVSWFWMTTNPFNPSMDTTTWKMKVLAALPRFEELNREQKEMLGDIPRIDWFEMATPMLMYTQDQVHFPLWAYRELAKVIAHSLCTS